MNQKLFRTLFLWVAWAAAALAVYLTMYQDTGVWAFLANDTSHITWLIIALFLIGVIASFISALTITLETLAANEVENHLQDADLLQLNIPNARRAVYRFFHVPAIDNQGQWSTRCRVIIECRIILLPTYQPHGRGYW